MQILLLEPDQVLAKTYIEALKDNHKIKWLNTAEAAISEADKNRPELIILEIKLPTHSGVEFLYEFRSYDDWQNIPIVILSSIPQAELRVSDSVWQKLDIKNYLYKPTTSLRQLAMVVENLRPIKV